MSDSRRPTPAATPPGPGEATGPAADGDGPVAPGAKTILICEDEDTLRELLRATLGPKYRYAEAVDGPEALRLARTSAPDLVLLDLMLPQTSGFEVLEAIRSNPATEKTPVVVITAWSHVEEEAEEAGADRFLAKPFEPSELQEIVRDLVGDP